MEEVATIFNQFAFPIACCVYLFYIVHEQSKTHKEEIDELKDAVNNNTLTMQKLIDRLEVGVYDGGRSDG